MLIENEQLVEKIKEYYKELKEGCNKYKYKIDCVTSHINRILEIAEFGTGVICVHYEEVWGDVVKGVFNKKSHKECYETYIDLTRWYVTSPVEFIIGKNYFKPPKLKDKNIGALPGDSIVPSINSFDEALKSLYLAGLRKRSNFVYDKPHIIK